MMGHITFSYHIFISHFHITFSYHIFILWFQTDVPGFGFGSNPYPNIWFLYLFSVFDLRF